MKNYCEWFLKQPINLFNYNAFLLQQGHNIYNMEIRQIVLEEIDEYILKLNNIEGVNILTREIELIRKDIVMLYIILLNKNYFNKKSPQYFSEILLGGIRTFLYANGATSIYPAYYNSNITSELLYALHYFITDDGYKQVVLRKYIFNNYILHNC